MYYGFRCFHPTKGEPPNALAPYGSDIVSRARFLLRGWSVAQIKGAMKAVNWIVEGPEVRGWVWNRLGTEAQMSNSVAGSKRSRGEVKAAPGLPVAPRSFSLDIANVRACEHLFDLSGYPASPELNWATFYAVFALGLIDKACDDEQHFGSWPKQEQLDWQHEWRILDHVAAWLVEASEAVTLAEAHATQSIAVKHACEEALTQERKKLSTRNVQAAIQRHAKTGDATDALYDFYRAGKYKSARQAVQLFCEKEPSLVAHLAPTNRIRTLSERLGKRLRERPL